MIRRLYWGLFFLPLITFPVFARDPTNASEVPLWQLLLPAIPGLIVGLAALIWNIYQSGELRTLRTIAERKEYTLRAFDRHVADPVDQSLKIVDELVEEIVKAAYDSVSTSRNKKLTALLSRVLPSLTNAYRLCYEVDEYLKAQGYTGDFEERLLNATPNERLDDVLVTRIAAILGGARVSKEVQIITRVVSAKKAEIRSTITDKGREIARQIVQG